LQCADEMSARWRGSTVADAISTIYMRTWLGSLYAVVEGWTELGMTDPGVASLLRMTTEDLSRTRSPNATRRTWISRDEHATTCFISPGNIIRRGFPPSSTRKGRWRGRITCT